MIRSLLIIISSLVAGLVIGLNLQATPAPSDKLPSIMVSGGQGNEQRISLLEQRISELEKQLQQEIKLRTSALDAVNKRIAEASSKPASILLPEIPQSDPPSPPDFANSQIEEPQKTQKDILISLGIPETTISSLKAKQEQREMSQLYLRNQATREGWYGTEKYFEKTRELEGKSNLYRDELGDEKYDEYLFNAGQFNRVLVKTVISGSPAEEIGIENGDIIYSYDKTRLFTWMELTELTATGKAGDMVPVTVIRNDEQLDLYIPRGPLGVRLSGKKVNPLDN